jgi:hypothetical protein
MALDEEEKALTAQKNAEKVLTEGKKRLEEADAEVPRADKANEDAKKAVTKAHDNKKEAVKKADGVISNLEAVHATKVVEQNKASTNQDKATEEHLKSEKQYGLRVKEKVAASDNLDLHDKKAKAAHKASKDY